MAASSLPHARAVGYLRRSTSKQEKSLDDQRREIERYASEHGYGIVRYYEDDGISGDSTDKRRGFQAMHKAACNGRDFDCILCWDLDRFGRFNSIEGGYWIHPLMRAGVRLVTVTEGPIDWHGFAGRIVNAVKQEGKHQYLVDLSRNVARGQITTALNGWLTGQRAPYGYDRMLVDEAGEHKQRVGLAEQVAKPRAWHVTLVPSSNAEVVSTLRWMFTTFAERDVGMRGLADRLNAKGIPGPNGGPWYSATIRAILTNEAYAGTFVWPKRRLGKYHRVALNIVKQRDANEITCTGEPAAVDNVREEQIVKPDCWEALIDQSTFDAVQAKLLRRRRAGNGQGYRTHTKSNGDRYLLSGLVYCERCGCKMHGTNNTRVKNGKTYSYPKYICSTYCRSGKNNPSGCGCHAIDQDGLVAALLRKLREQVLVSGSRDKLRDMIQKRLSATAAKPQTQLADLRRSIAELDRDIDRGTKRLIRCPDEVVELLSKELAGLRRQRDRLAGELAGLGRRETADTVEVDAIVDRLWRLDQELQNADPERLRELLSRMVQRIELRFDHVQRGKKLECPPAGGSVILHPASIFCSVNRGDRI